MVDKFKSQITVFTKEKEYAVFTEAKEPVTTKRGFNFWKLAVWIIGVVILFCFLSAGLYYVIYAPTKPTVVGRHM